MFKDREKLYQLYLTMLTIALTWALLLVINRYYELRVVFMISLIYAIVPTLIIYLVDRYKKSTIGLLILASFLPIVAIILWITKTNPFLWFGDMTRWVKVYNGKEVLYIAQYAHLIMIGVAFLSSVLFFLLIRNSIAKKAVAVIVFLSLIVISIMKIEVDKIVVCIAIFYWASILVEMAGYKKRRNEKREGILYLAPICLLLAFLAVMLPSKPEPIQWKTVKNVYHSVVERFEIWQTELNYYFTYGSSEFTINLTGYSEDPNKLGNDSGLIEDDKIALKLSGVENQETAYLLGSISDIYTRNGWEKSRRSLVPGEQDYLLDYMELYYAIARQDIEVLESNKFLDQQTIRIIYHNIKTKTLFYPLKMSTLKLTSGNKKRSSELSQILFNKAHGKGTSYQIIYYRMNLQGEAFIQMLRDTDSFSYQNRSTIHPQAAEYVKTNILTKEDDVLEENYEDQLARRAFNIKKYYTSLPDSIPMRVYELAERITEGYRTQYDKMKAIEKYLLMNYTYSLEGQKISEDKNYLDYFLFEGKKGYCTSYATALAVLGRCVGIPTRYVEGFLGKASERDKNSVYIVRNRQAHAWTEAYFEGVGWIPFEATPPFYENRYSGWAQESKNSKDFGMEDSGNGNLGVGQNIIPEVIPSIMPQPEGDIIEGTTDKILEGVLICVAAIVIFIVSFAINYKVLSYRYWREYQRSDSSHKMYLLFLRILEQLKREGFELERQETILMLSRRVKDQYIFNTITFSRVADIFMRYRYADELITQEELEVVNTFLKGLRNKEKSEESRLKLWLKEYLFLTNKRKN